MAPFFNVLTDTHLVCIPLVVSKMKKDKKTRINISISQSIKNRMDRIRKGAGGAINWSNLIETEIEAQLFVLETFIQNNKGKELFEEKLRYLLNKYEENAIKRGFKGLGEFNVDLITVGAEIEKKKNR